MSTVEILFGKFFERKNSVIEQLNQQKDLYDQYLASTCLINGIRPPSWLLKDGFETGSSEIKELKNEDLISGLLFPPSRANYPSSIGSKTFYSRSIFAANTVKQLSGDFFSETCASNKYYSVGERSADIPNCPLDGKNIELESTLNTVPELDNTIFSPQNQTDLTNHFDVTTVGERSTVDPKCSLNGSSLKSECTFNTITHQGGTTGTPQCQTDLKVSESSFELPQSLARIQRSRSRQRALELRNSASGKSRKRAIQESNVAAGRSTRSRTSCEQPPPAKELLETDARISSIPYQVLGSIATSATQSEGIDLHNVLDAEGTMEGSSPVQKDPELCNSAAENTENNLSKENATTYEDNIRSQTTVPQINSAELGLARHNNSDKLTGRITCSRSSSINRSPQHLNPLDLVERHDLPKASDLQVLNHEEISAAGIALNKHVNVSVDCNSTCTVTKQEGVSMGASLEFLISRSRSDEINFVEPKQLIFDDVEDSRLGETFGPSFGRETLQASDPQVLIHEEISAARISEAKHVADMPVDRKYICSVQEDVSVGGSLEFSVSRPQSDDMKFFEPKQLVFGDAEDLEHVETVGPSPGREILNQSPEVGSTPLGLKGSVDELPISSVFHAKGVLSSDGSLLKKDHGMEMVIESETMTGSLPHVEERFENAGRKQSLESVADASKLCSPLLQAERAEGYEGFVTDRSPERNEKNINMSSDIREKCNSIPDDAMLKMDQNMEVVGAENNLKAKSGTPTEVERSELVGAEKAEFDLHPISPISKTSSISALFPRQSLRQTSDFDVDRSSEGSKMSSNKVQVTGHEFLQEPSATSMDRLERDGENASIRLSNAFYEDERPELLDTEETRDRTSSAMCTGAVSDISSLALRKESPDIDRHVVADRSSECDDRKRASDSSFCLKDLQYGRISFGCKLEGALDIDLPDVGVDSNKDTSGKNLTREFDLESLPEDSRIDRDAGSKSSSRQSVKQDISLVHDASQVPHLFPSAIHEEDAGCSKSNDSSKEENSVLSAMTSYNGWENSWPQCKRRKIEGQSDKGFTTCPRIWSAKPNHHEDIVCLNLNSAETGSGTDLEFQQFPVSGVVESSIIESAVGEMSNGAKHLVMEGVQCSPQIHAEEAEVDEGFVLGDANIPLGFIPMLLESSLGSSGIKVEDTGIHLNEVEEQYPFSVAMSVDRQCLPQYEQKFFCFESEKTPRSMGEACSTEQDIKSNLEEQLLSNYDNLDLVGADQSMPEFEKFTDLPDTIIEGMSILEELCPSSGMGTPYSLPSKSKFQMDLSTWSGYNPLEPGRSYSDFMPSSSDQSECDAWSPYTPQVGKATHTILSSSGGQRSKKQRSTNSELTPIHEDSSSGGEENRNLCKVIYQVQEKSSAIEMKSSTYKGPLVDISNINPLDFVSGNEKIFERGRLIDSLEEDANLHGSEIGPSKMSKDDFGTERKYKNKDKENKSSSLCGYGTEMKYMNKDRESKSSSTFGTGTRKSTRCLQNTVSKPNLQRKATAEKRNHTTVDKAHKGSNIATDVKSLFEYLPTAVPPAKRKEPKVKALDLAKETKKQEEEKKKQREMMKEKRERERERQKEEKAREEELMQRQKEEKEHQRERLKEEKARQQELIQKRKEVEAKRKEAEMQERKRLREDEKKEKDRKKLCREPQKKLHAGKEEKELKYRAADDKASKKKGFQDEEMKDQNPEKVKGREECAKGRQTQTKKASGVHEHSVALEESHSNENAVNCFGQVNEVGSLATGGTLEQSYDISPYQSSDGEEDDDLPSRKVIPSWSRQYCPAPHSCSQQPKDIFKLSSFCNINQVLKSRKSFK
ncbi:uncharacterized protein LOC113288173 [Papaver somniferum]|uniref:uncharacterized protein LOC113288173 n=1 Tax=Papaver somniferum TaxID=3469 RepID=UPI000E6F9427|nr:uncharacterized protein LOC113288173 [Papaver somniferum]